MTQNADIADVLDNPNADVAALDTDAAPGAAAPDKAHASATSTGKFKELSEAEAAYAELQRKLGEQGSELGELRKTVQSRDERDRVAEQLAKIEANTRKPEDREAAFERYVKAYAAKTGGDVDATRELFSTIAGWMGEETARVRDELKAEREERAKELAALRASQEKMTPEAIENRKEIDRLQRDHGLSFAQAKAIAVEQRARTAAAERLAHPEGSAGARVTQRTVKTELYISDADWAKLKDEYPNLDDGDRAQMEADHTRAKASQRGAR